MYTQGGALAHCYDRPQGIHTIIMIEWRASGNAPSIAARRLTHHGLSQPTGRRLLALAHKDPEVELLQAIEYPESPLQGKLVREVEPEAGAPLSSLSPCAYRTTLAASEQKMPWSRGDVVE
jgi:hypothetical protein